jgi:hypothetical protein
MLEKAPTASPLENEDANRNSPSSGKRRTERSKKANGSNQKGEPPFAHDPFISLEIPSAREPVIAEALSSFGGKLAERLGRPVALSWFDRSTVVDVVGDTITMRFPTEFKTSRVRADYEPDLLACCSALIPSIKLIRFTVAAENAA